MSAKEEKKVAAKISQSDDEEMQLLFKKEFDLLKSIKHPNFVKAYKFQID